MFVTAAVLLYAVQGSSGSSLAGRIRDGLTGAPLGGAAVILADLDRTAVTDAAGRYLFEGVPAGPQHLVVRRIGYAPSALHALVPGHGSLEIDVSLRALPLALDPVQAVAALPVPDLEASEGPRYPNRELSIAAIRHHPMLAEPDALHALSTGDVVVRPEAPAGIHLRGGAADQTAYLLDGIPVFSPYHAAGTFGAWNPDALRGVSLLTTVPGSGFPDALSGVVSATTRAPGARVGVQGGISTTHARLTLDGPIASGAGFLLSMRSGFSGFPVPPDEPSYLRSDATDWLGKLVAPVLGGALRVTGFQTSSAVDVASGIPRETPDAGDVPARHQFDWRSWSAGVGWLRQLKGAVVELRLWSARGTAGAIWNPPDSAPERLRSARVAQGLLLGIQWGRARHSTEAALRFENGRTRYRVAAANGAGTRYDVATPAVAALFNHGWRVNAHTRLDLGVTATMVGEDGRVAPSARVEWKPASSFLIGVDYAVRHQFAQSLRNSESTFGGIFPADLFVGASNTPLPVASSDHAILSFEYQPATGFRIMGQGYLRGSRGLVLVSPAASEPFATGSFLTGSAAAQGGVLEFRASGTRYGVVASYGYQDVRFDFGSGNYVPEHGSRHRMDVGAVVYPSATLALRIGTTAIFGRRATALTGGLEWESCNLVDAGCEFAGTPRYDSNALGAVRLPGYISVDLGVRKHWHTGFGGRDGQLAVFGTVTNVFGRENVLTRASDPATGSAAAITMRPRAPLLVGVDWRF
jgi:hypothetical protein